MAREYDTLLASAVRAADTYASKAHDMDGYNTLAVFVDVTALAAGSTVDVTVEDTPDTDASSARWFTHTAFTQITATGKATKRLSIFGRHVRVSAVVGGSGTPSATFQVNIAKDVQ